MAYIVMAQGEDGLEFRPSDISHPTQEYAEWEYDRLKAEGNWPCAQMWVEKYRGLDAFEYSDPDYCGRGEDSHYYANER